MLSRFYMSQVLTLILSASAEWWHSRYEASVQRAAHMSSASMISREHKSHPSFGTICNFGHTLLCEQPRLSMQRCDGGVIELQTCAIINHIKVAHAKMNYAWVCSNQIYSDSCERHEREQERDTKLFVTQRVRCEVQCSRRRAIHAMASMSRLAVGRRLDAIDCSDPAGRAYGSANARDNIERTASVGACETRARCCIRAVAVAVRTTAGRARA